MNRTTRDTVKPRLAPGKPGPPLSPLPQRNAVPNGGWKFLLPLILIIFLALALAHSNLSPVGQTGYQNAPDEDAHVHYAVSLSHGHLPTREEAALDPSGHSYEWHQPPLYYLIAAPLAQSGTHALRLVSIGCGLCCLLLIYGAGRILFPDDPLIGITAACFAALIPSHIAITSTVNNDPLLEVCFSTALLLLITMLMRGMTYGRCLMLGVTIGAAILTKATGMLLLPIAAFSFLLMLRGEEKGRFVLRGAVIAFSAATLIGGWWFLHNLKLYGQPLPMKVFQQAFGATAQAADVASGKMLPLPAEGWLGYWLLILQWTFQSFWAVYGTRGTAANGLPAWLPTPIYELAAILSAVAAAGLGKLHFARSTQFTPAQLRCVWLLFAVIGIVLFAFVAFVSTYFQTQARYLYPAMLPISLLFAIGWRFIFPDRYRSSATLVLLGILLLFCLVFLSAVQAAALPR